MISSSEFRQRRKQNLLSSGNTVLFELTLQYSVFQNIVRVATSSELVGICRACAPVHCTHLFRLFITQNGVLRAPGPAHRSFADPSGLDF
jgi:hypothetical protein